ncbi:hypothetical protein JCM11641_007088 [Rhodosporidiobolus odoratus]
MDQIKATTIPCMRLSRSDGSSTSSSSPLDHQTPASFHLTTHHIIFKPQQIAQLNHTGEATHSNGATTGHNGRGGVDRETELWIPLPLLHSVTRSPPTLTGSPSPLILRTRDNLTYSLDFVTTQEADSVWDSLKGLCASFSTGGLENRYAFFGRGRHGKDTKGKGRAGWDIYSPEEEFARMGVGSRSKAWRFTSINADFQFCPSYPAQIVVPARISDTTLSYAVKYRSKSRIPGLVYLHWANLGSITRSSQPMVGITQNARSIQDEKLIEAIFSSHSQHSHSLTPMSVSDRPSSPSAPLDPSSGGVVYGATPLNIIIDARPTKNAYANSVKGAGTENMLYYKNCEKEYLGIDNIHVMRSSLSGVFDALAYAETSGVLDRAALRRTGWLPHLTNILDGVLTIVRTVHINNSHALVHCSDGWDRTSQLSALPQLCLDPFFRTARGLAVLIEKDWVSYGHKFADRSGHLCNDRVAFVQKLGDDASTQQAFLASVTKQFAPSSHSFKETCPVFQQFLDCIYQVQRQFPDRFEWNETLLRHLVRESYGGESGTFLFNSERERAELRVRERTSSVWESVFDLEVGGEGKEDQLTLKSRFRNPSYNPALDNPDSKAPGADQGVLLFNPQDVQWWFELFGRSDEDMNGSPLSNDPGALPQEPTLTETRIVEPGQTDSDPVFNPLNAQSANLSLSNSATSPSRLSAPLPPPTSTSRSSSPSASPSSLRFSDSVQQPPLSDTVASVQKLGWSAWKSVRKFGEDAARQYKEAQASRVAQEAEMAAQLGHGVEGSSGSCKAMGGSQGADELADGAGWGSPSPSAGDPLQNGAVGGGSTLPPAAPATGGTGSLGRSTGSMWSRFSAGNPWASGAEVPGSNGGMNGSSTFATSTNDSATSPSSSSSFATSTSATTQPSYKPYQPRPRPDQTPSSSTTALSYPSTLSASSRPPGPAPRQSSIASTFSVNPWETISREEAVPSTAVSSSAPSPVPPPVPFASESSPPTATTPTPTSTLKTVGKVEEPLSAAPVAGGGKGVDPLGVGLA